MTRIVKIKCNGPSKHVNEIDLDAMLRTTTTVRGNNPPPISPDEVPTPLVRRCRDCTYDIVIDREMLRKMLK